ncbi:MAG TPA: hypothetical protein VK453_24075 [Micromonosporaceae bacterium]|nr:hypothetical protein [Micromonosporaceae bacterium]
MRGGARVAVAVAAGVAARAALSAAVAAPGASALRRTNFRGAQVSLVGGPVLALTGSVAAVAGALRAGDPSGGRVAAAAAVAGLACGLVGGYDDIVGARPHQRAAKGFRGHLRALRSGRITSGLVKIAGVGAAGLAAAAIIDGGHGGRSRHRVVDVLLGAGVVAGTANLINLFDLRPGRALKVGLVLAGPLVGGGGPGSGLAAGALGAAVGVLPADLDERIMLGDAGANALGALIGTAALPRTGRSGRAALLAGIVALTAASERVSFTRVIAGTPVLRELDALGRRAG